MENREENEVESRRAWDAEEPACVVDVAGVANGEGSGWKIRLNAMPDHDQ